MPPPGNYGYQGPPYQGQGPNIGFVNPIQPHGAGFQMPGANPNSGPDNKPLNPPYMDSTDPNYVAGFGFDDKTIRRGFIRKVYSILSVSNSIFVFIQGSVVG